MALDKQCQQETPIDRFANEYIAFLQREIGSTSWQPLVKVLECDEAEWAGLYGLQQMTSSYERRGSDIHSLWLRRVDAFSLPAIVRYPTGEARRSSEVERMGKFIKFGVRQHLASMIAKFDAVIFLRRSKLQSTGAKLHIVAGQCAAIIERIAYAGTPPPSRQRFGENVPAGPRLFEQFKNRIGPSEFDKRYLQSQH
jgi:hypothetical protein